MTDTFKMVLSYYDMACTPASVAPVVDIGACVAMKATVSICHLLLFYFYFIYRIYLFFNLGSKV